jgi:hypothetical protein
MVEICNYCLSNHCWTRVLKILCLVPPEIVHLDPTETETWKLCDFIFNVHIIYIRTVITFISDVCTSLFWLEIKMTVTDNSSWWECRKWGLAVSLAKLPWYPYEYQYHSLRKTVFQCICMVYCGKVPSLFQCVVSQISDILVIEVYISWFFQHLHKEVKPYYLMWNSIEIFCRQT